MAGFRWQTPPSEVWPAGAAAYVAAVKRGVHGVMLFFAPVIENEMKVTASWTDRTGNLRSALYSVVEPASAAEVQSMIELIMAHGLIYGWYLEGFRTDGTPMLRPPRFQIIEPTLDKYAPLVWAAIQRLFR